MWNSHRPPAASSFLTSAHVPCTMPRASRPKGRGVLLRLPSEQPAKGQFRATYPRVPTLTWPRERPFGGPLVLHKPSSGRTVPLEQVVCVVCTVHGTVVSLPRGVPPRPSSNPGAGAHPHREGLCGEVLAVKLAFPRETGGDEFAFLTRGSTTNRPRVHHGL